MALLEVSELGLLLSQLVVVVGDLVDEEGLRLLLLHATVGGVVELQLSSRWCWQLSVWWGSGGGAKWLHSWIIDSSWHLMLVLRLKLRLWLDVMDMGRWRI